MPNNIGDKTVFEEHWVLIKDIDSKDEEPVLVNIRKDPGEGFEKLAEAQALKTCALAMGGNTLHAEYQGKTGRTMEAEWKVIKCGWVTGAEITPKDDNFNIDDHFKID
jgi:hypothetical protein